SYQLTVDPKQARLTAPGPLGVLRGLETFLQLARADAGRVVVPAVRVSDRPRFAWRGLMLDPCRRWEPVEMVKRTLDGMASVKLNVLHWHLSEDQGFRVESKVYPKLHGLGSDGNFYTQDLVREGGIFDNVVDPSREEVYTFLDRFFGEMAGLFPDAYMHIGGDEVTPRQWNASVPVQDFIYRNNLAG